MPGRAAAGLDDDGNPPEARVNGASHMWVSSRVLFTPSNSLSRLRGSGALAFGPVYSGRTFKSRGTACTDVGLWEKT